MLPEPPSQRRLQFGDLPPQSALGQIGQRRRIRLALDQRLQHGPGRDALDIRGHRRQLDVGVLQDLLQPVGGRAALAQQASAIPGEVAQVALRTPE